MIFHRLRRAAATIAVACLFNGYALAERNDVVVLLNGDSVTGEVEGLDFGELSYSTDSMGTVSIDWEDIVSVTATHTLQVEVSSGQRYFGTLILASDTDHIAVVRAGGIQELPKSDVIRMVPIDVEEKFIDRLEGSASFGFDTNKGSGVTTLRLNGDVRYRTRDYLVGLSSNTTITEQEGEDSSRRANLSANYQRFRDNRWFTDWTATWEQNEELGINSRISAGVGLGRFFIQTNKNQFSVTAGVVGTQESIIGEEEGSTQGEGKITVRYMRRVLKPSTDISFVSNVFPLLQDLSSYRAETDLTLRREFIDDLFFDLSFYHSYQSDPPEGAEQEDYGIVTSLGYSF